MAKGAYIGVDGVARKVKKGYVGVLADVPVYEIQTVTEILSETTISDVFEVTNGSYYFAGNGTVFTSNNGGVSNSTATTTLKAKFDVSAISFSYSYSTEATYDKFTLVVAGATVESAVSGTTTTKVWSGALTAGQEISFTYTKDSSQNGNDDKCMFFDMSATYTKSVLTGYESKGLARKIKKAYIGIGGVARPCWSGGELAYYGTITPLDTARYRPEAASIGDYALFAGGQNSVDFTGNSGWLKSVEAYDATLTKTIPDTLAKRTVNFASTTAGSRAFFAGGENAESLYLDFISTYDANLTYGATTLSSGRYGLKAAAAGSYALFAGGAGEDTVEAYNSDTLSEKYVMDLTHLLGGHVGVSIGDYALFAGGSRAVDEDSSSELTTMVTAYNSNLTRDASSVTLSVAREDSSATTVGDYALVAGGGAGSVLNLTLCDTVDAIDSSLTRITAPALSIARRYMMAASLNNFAIFCGGYASGSKVDIVDVYDELLTHSIGEPLSTARYYGAAATAGNYIIVAGGHDTEGDPSAIADAYTIA